MSGKMDGLERKRLLTEAVDKMQKTPREPMPALSSFGHIEGTLSAFWVFLTGGVGHNPGLKKPERVTPQALAEARLQFWKLFEEQVKPVLSGAEKDILLPLLAIAQEDPWTPGTILRYMEARGPILGGLSREERMKIKEEETGEKL